MALLGVVTTLVAYGAEVLVASLDDHHLHVLVRFRDHDSRRRMGWAKLAATKKAKEAIAALKAHDTAVGLDLEVRQGIWAKGTKSNPIADRAHQLRTVPYIHDHADRGAVVYLQPNAERYLRKTDQLKSPRHRRGSAPLTSPSDYR